MPKEKPQVSIFIDNARNEISLHERDYTPGIEYQGKLATIGGEVEDGESDEEAGIRELWDETDYRYNKLEFVKNFFFDGYRIALMRVKDPNLNDKHFKTYEGTGKGMFFSPDELKKDDLAFNVAEMATYYYDKYYSIKLDL